MKWWRWYILLGLFLLPVIILMGLGFYFLWQSGWGLFLGWGLLACIGLAYFLALRWQKKQKLLQPPMEIPLVWTDRDHEAWKIVEQHTAKVKDFTAEQLVSLKTYQETAETLALDLARFYHPKSKDPISALTIPEILTVIELATHDLAEMVDQYLPGGHLLTLRDFQRIKKAADWYPTISNLAYMVSAVFSPVNTAARYLTANAGLTKPWQMLQQNVLVWFYTAYANRLGVYLIELNSGRLGVGADRYLQLKGRLRKGVPSHEPSPEAADVEKVTLVLLGQTNAGKSSLVNALLGEQRAFTDVLPATAAAQRYQLQPEGIDTKLELIDTVGYGTQGPTQDQQRHTEELAKTADVLILVLHARQPGRQADLTQLEQLDRYFKSHPELLRPPIISVLTHVDLLSPAMEWAPPYDWLHPQRTKEQSMSDALATVQQQFGPLLKAVVPVCTAQNKVFGINEGVLPALSAILNQAQAVGLLRALHAEKNHQKVKRVFQQLLSLGKGLLGVVAEQWPQRKEQARQ
ncbi:MAG: 50S ribosome-binding GTPase [Gemmatales bacterium]